jgi:serine/threonine protein kinase
MLCVELDNAFVEEVNVYVEYMEASNESPDGTPQQRCVSIERPQLTLDKVVAGMMKNGGYSSNRVLRLKYSAKVCSVLRLIGKALRHLHSSGVIHGNVCMETCGKFEDSSWKLLERLDVQVIGETIKPSRFRRSFPPESLELSEHHGPVYDSDDSPVSFSRTLAAHPSFDIWSFGQVCYESLVGKPLVEFDRSPSKNVASLLQVMEWDESNMQAVFSDLLETGIEESGADMITSCLFPRPEDRPSSMDEILDHSFWRDMRKHRSKKNRHGGDSVESSRSLLTEAETFEV